MSTRAMVGYTMADGTWKAVWNHWDGQTQHLGRWIIRQIKKGKGDLEGFRTQYIDACPEGWSSMEKGERCEDPVGFLTGKFDGIVASCNEGENALCYDTNYLYLVHPPKRRLYVFEVTNATMRPFGMITFDDAGNPTPKALPKVEE